MYEVRRLEMKVVAGVKLGQDARMYEVRRLEMKVVAGVKLGQDVRMGSWRGASRRTLARRAASIKNKISA